MCLVESIRSSTHCDRRLEVEWRAAPFVFSCMWVCALRRDRSRDDCTTDTCDNNDVLLLDSMKRALSRSAVRYTTHPNTIKQLWLVQYSIVWNMEYGKTARYPL